MISAKYCAFMKSRKRCYDGSDDSDTRTPTGQGHIVSALERILRPVKVVVACWAAHADVTPNSTRTQHGRLTSPILLGEVGSLESWVASLLLELLELELVHAGGGGEGKENEGSESGEDHGGKEEGETQETTRCKHQPSAFMTFGARRSTGKSGAGTCRTSAKLTGG